MNVGFFAHFSALAHPLQALPTPVLFAPGFFTLYRVAIALCKDVPDVRRDRFFGVNAIRAGRTGGRAARVCRGARSAGRARGRVLLCAGAQPVRRRVSLTLHLVTAGVLARRGSRVDAERADDVFGFYMLAWKAFYLEYVLLPLFGL